MTVDVGDRVAFRFSSPLSITSLCVCNRLEEQFWDFIADEFKPALVSEGGWAESGSFQTWPMDQAPPEVLSMLAQIQEREDRRLQEEGPRKPALFEVVYGVLPRGYRERSPAKPLTPGDYAVLIFAEQGQAHAHFTIAPMPKSETRS